MLREIENEKAVAAYKAKQKNSPGLGSVVLLFILGSSLGGVGSVRGLRGGGRGGWCEEWARSG
jgi:hypothetical protein